LVEPYGLGTISQGTLYFAAASERITVPDDRGSRQRSLEEFQDNVRRAEPAAGASYGLIGAIILFGGIGYGIDVWKGSAPWGLLGGLLLGLIVGFYGLAKLVWKR
jgi:F0F1-type ATP synthase assembly protein I